MTQLSLSGVIVPMVTPVGPDGAPDFNAVARLTAWLLETGVGGLFVAGTTGRFSHFTPEELAEVCRVVVEHAKGRVPVLAGIADSGSRRMARNADRMTAAGADYLVATAPYYLKYSAAERERLLAELVMTAPRPVILYNIPELVGATLRAEWVCEIGCHPNARGLKDSSNDYAYFQFVLAHRPRPDFALIQGKEPLLAQSLAAGADGIVVSLAHLAPKNYVQLCHAARNGQADEAAECQRMVTEHYDQLVRGFKLQPCFSTLLGMLERGLAAQGLPMQLLADKERV